MTPLRFRDDFRAQPAAIARCPVCIRRVASLDPGCPHHGPIPTVTGDDRDYSSVIAVERPSFRGYETGPILGRGGFGTVFEATRQADGKRVAIKLARADRPGADARLLDEITALEGVGPPHVPAVFARGTSADGSPYVVMEYVAAEPLASRLFAGAEPIPKALACSISIAILEVLEAIHAKGYVHRDLKPENILLDEHSRVKILDLGLASSTSPHAPGSEGSEGSRVTEVSRVTEERVAVGTVDYMAPEQCEGRVNVDVRADIYAMGVILYELIAGRPPFSGSPTVVKQSHVSLRPPPLSPLAHERVPTALEAIVQRCLAKDRDDRFDSAMALREALERVRGDLASTPVSTSLDLPGQVGPTGAQPARISRQDERRTLCLLLFETGADVMAVRAAIGSLGGHPAFMSGHRYVATFGQGLGANPAQQALTAARSLLQDKVCSRVRLDLAPVLIQIRKDGSRRFLSPLFARSERFPAGNDPPGLSFTPAFVAVRPELTAEENESPPSVRAPSLSPHAPDAPDADDDPRLVSLNSGMGPLFGRDDLLAALSESAQRATRDALPTIDIILGDVGEGKSRLASVLGDGLRALGPRIEVIELRAQRQVFSSADRTLRELLERLLDLPAAPPPEGAEELLRDRLDSIALVEMMPTVALALGWVLTSARTAPMGPGLRTMEAAPGALRSALILATGEALRRQAARRPLALVLDDAHLADELLLGALEYATLAEAGAPLWICALGRPGFKVDHPAWGERAAQRDEHRLGPLDPASSARLCRWLLQPVEDVSSAAVERLVARAKGCPLFLIELVRGLKRDNIVRRSSRGDAWYLATDELDRLPDLPLVEWLVQLELDALSPVLRAHARLLALLGEEVTIPEITGVVHRLEQQGGAAELPLDAKIAVQRLLAAGIVSRGSRGQIGFRHALAREEVARSAPEALRRRVHFAAVVHYGDNASTSEDRWQAQFAFHAARAGLGPTAARAYLELARTASLRHAYTEAEGLYSRSLEQPVERDTLRREAYRGRGLMRYRIGRYHDALIDFSCARAMASEEGDILAQIELLFDEATALDWMDDFTSSEERVEGARALMPASPPPLLHARLLLGRGRSAQRLSREKEAAELLYLASVEAGRLGDEGYETLVISLLMLGFVLQGLGRLPEAGVALDAMVVLCEEHGDTFHLGGAFINRGLLRAVLGQKAGMVADLERCIAIARGLGQGSLERMSEYDLGEYLYLMDDLEAAEPHVRRAQAIDRRLVGSEGRAVLALLEARFACYRGDHASAESITRAIRERQTRARAEGRTDALMVPSDDVLCSMVELSIHDGSAAEWDDLEARSASSSVGQERIEVIESRAMTALRHGRSEAARRALERAFALAATIPNVMGERLRRREVELEAAESGPTEAQS